jgi:hypothetical protein
VTEPVPYGEPEPPAPPPTQNPLRRLLGPVIALVVTLGKWGAIILKL